MTNCKDRHGHSMFCAHDVCCDKITKIKETLD